MKKTILAAIILLVTSLPGLKVLAESASATVQFKALLMEPEASAKALLYRIVPRLKRDELRAELPRHLQNLTLPELKTNLFFGMGESEQAQFTPILLTAFESPYPEIQAAAAEALGRLRAPQAEKPFKEFLGSPLNGPFKAASNPFLVEAVCMAAGRIGFTEALTPSLQNFSKEFHGPQQAGLLALRLGSQLPVDRQVAGIFWMVGDLQRQAEHEDILTKLFRSQAVRSSIAAAKSIVQWEGAPPALRDEARQYLRNLARNVEIDAGVRLLAARAVVSAEGLRAIYLTENAMADTRLAILREVGSRKIPEDIVANLLASNDDGLLAEGVLAVVERTNSQSAGQIKAAMAKPKTRLAQALLTYAQEEIDPRP